LYSEAPVDREHARARQIISRRKLAGSHGFNAFALQLQGWSQAPMIRRDAKVSEDTAGLDLSCEVHPPRKRRCRTNQPARFLLRRQPGDRLAAWGVAIQPIETAAFDRCRQVFLEKLEQCAAVCAPLRWSDDEGHTRKPSRIFNLRRLASLKLPNPESACLG